MKENLHDFLQYIPFIGLALQDATNNTHQPIVIRLIEAAIIGGIVMYGTQQVMAERMDGFEDRLIEVKQDIKQIRSDIYTPYTGQNK